LDTTILLQTLNPHQDVNVLVTTVKNSCLAAQSAESNPDALRRAAVIADLTNDDAFPSLAAT
jgi:hypothetical protein